MWTGNSRAGGWSFLGMLATIQFAGDKRGRSRRGGGNVASCRRRAKGNAARQGEWARGRGGEGETAGLLCRKNGLMAKADKKTEKKSASKSKEEPQRLVSENRKARFRFEILDTLECGIQLT